MRIAIAGATGTVGRLTLTTLRARGHETVSISRTGGVDLMTGNGVDAAVEGADVVIDLASVQTLSAKVATDFFTTSAGNLLKAANRHGVGHVVVLSIVGIDRIPFDYYAGKVAHEQVVASSDVPWTILRATQFHEFAGQMFDRAKLGPLHVAPRARVQPIAGAEVAEHLADLAEAAPAGRVPDLAGPREERLDEMVRTYARRSGYRGWVPSVSLPGGQMKGMRAGLALPGPDAVLGRQTFSEWLAAI